ncbi:MAG: hypothetical protein CVU57_28325 [Deltaproteobacteria bacterium HGW-Deltaproteobacteria-15]|nr:MAG: hypothetical protein CVU57_28325 [Deltaproteobacteria bacterium HGW-Deltaproteobacteria-15]
MDNRKKGCGYRTGSQDLPDGRLSRLKNLGSPPQFIPHLMRGGNDEKAPVCHSRAGGNPQFL